MASTMVKLSKKIGRLFLCRILFFLLPAAAAAIHDAVQPDDHANEIRLLQLELDDLRAIVSHIDVFPMVFPPSIFLPNKDFLKGGGELVLLLLLLTLLVHIPF